MKTMMVDMDDVITSGRFFKLICTFLNQDIKLDEVKTYFLQELLGDRVDDFWRFVQNEDFYGDSPLYDGAYDTLYKYKDILSIYITTAYLWDGIIDTSGTNLANKYYYLRKVLPFLDREKYIFITDKSMLRFDIRLDDKVANLTDGETKLLFSAWHNQELPNTYLDESGIIRVNNWQEVDRELSLRYRH